MLEDPPMSTRINLIDRRWPKYPVKVFRRSGLRRHDEKILVNLVPELEPFALKARKLSAEIESREGRGNEHRNNEEIG